MASVETLTRIFEEHTSFFESTHSGLIQALIMSGSRPGNCENYEELLQYVKTLKSATRKDTPASVTRVGNIRYPPSQKAFKDLHPILLVNLLLDAPTKGYYLKVRTISTAIQCNGIMAVVQDENQNCGILFLDHQYDSANPEAFLPKLSVVLIKEPVYTPMYEGRRCIRVDHPADFTLLLDGDRRIPRGWCNKLQASSWYNSTGLKASRNWEYEKALRLFDTALSLHHSPLLGATIRYNRTKVYMALRYYDNVTDDVDCLVLQEHLRENALIRGIEAAYQLQNYDICHNYLGFLRHYFPNNPHHDGWVGRVCTRIKETRYGRYDFTSIWKNPPSADSPFVDLASYFGPIEPRETQAWGRGLFATKPVKAGELLLCEKALSVVLSDRAPQSGCFIVGHQETTLTTDITGFALRTDIVQKLEKNRTFRASFNKLYDGGYREHLAKGSARYVDAWFVDQVLSKNSFSAYANSREEHLWFANSIEDDNATRRVSNHGSGVWIQMSCMNHACIPNVHGSYYGEMLIVRAARDIAADEELFINYCPFGTVTSRQETLNHWGFQCTCQACTEEPKTSSQQLHDREAIYDILGQIRGKVAKKYNAFCYTEAAQHPESQREQHVRARKQFSKEVDELLALWHNEFGKLDSTFSAAPTINPRYENGRLLLDLAQFHYRAKKWSACKDCALQALSSLGFDINDSGTVARWGVTCDAAVTMAALLYKSAKELGASTLQQFEKTVKTIYLIVIGEDVSFEETYWWLWDEQEVEEAKGVSSNGASETITSSYPGIEVKWTPSTDGAKPHNLTLNFTSKACPVHAGGGLDTGKTAAPTSDPGAQTSEKALKKKKKSKKKRAKKQDCATVCETVIADVGRVVEKGSG